MEIEEMKALWSDMSDQLEEQKKLTNEIIMNMTQERYSNKFRTISTYETLGAVICFAMAMYILINFGALDTWYQITSGVFTIVFLFIQPILVLRALSKIKRLNILDKNYKETLVSFTKAKTDLLKLQQFGIAASFIFMITILAVFPKILKNKDFFMMEHSIWLYIHLVCTLVLAVFVCRWGYGHYKRITNSAEEVLKGLE
ncbi:MAG: hypothetical protein AB8B59_14745 [Maribacter sp.]